MPSILRRSNYLLEEDNVQVRDLMTPNPVCCTPSDTLRTVAQRMIEADCGCVPVVDSAENRRLLGVITDRDLAIRGLAKGMGPDTPVSELFTQKPMCCQADTDHKQVEQIMMEVQVRRVPVVDERGAIIGIVSQADIALAPFDGHVPETGLIVEEISKPSSERTR